MKFTIIIRWLDIQCYRICDNRGDERCDRRSDRRTDERSQERSIEAGPSEATVTVTQGVTTQPVRF
jgi:hypothetical protein